MHTVHMPGACGSQKRISDPLRLELQTVGVGAEIELGSSAEAIS